MFRKSEKINLCKTATRLGNQEKMGVFENKSGN